MQRPTPKPAAAPMPPATQGATTRDLEFTSSHATRLQGWRLVVARSVVVATMGAIIGLGLLALPGLVTLLEVPCADVINSCLISPQQVMPLARLSITPHALALGIVGLTCLAVLLVDAVAIILIWRRSDDWMALLVALTLVLLPAWLTPVLQGLTGVWQVAAQALSAVAFPSLALLAGLFPSGRFAPHWLWLPVLVAAIMPQVPFLGSMFQLISPLVLLSCYLGLIAGQIYRYRRSSTPVQRQQTKWAVSSIVLALLVNQLFWQPAALIPALQRPDSLYSLLFFPDCFLMIAILAVGFGVAVLRYRLYDIDVLINRSLVYGSLTAILGLLYVGGVFGLQAVANGLTRTQTAGGASSPIVIVATTLGIAALVRPLRSRLQSFIDRRFYRRKYDAEKTLAAFSATLRNEVDLEQLREQFIAVVQDTMQPTHVSLWLRPPARKKQPS